jgi:hypothetical protein
MRCVYRNTVPHHQTRESDGYTASGTAETPGNRRCSRGEGQRHEGGIRYDGKDPKWNLVPCLSTDMSTQVFGGEQLQLN